MGDGLLDVVYVVELVQADLDSFGEAGDATADERKRHTDGAWHIEDLRAGRLFNEGEAIVSASSSNA